MAKKYPVLQVYKGIQIRAINRVEILVPEPTFKQMIDACNESGMSMHKVLYFSSRPCERCDPEVVVYDKNGEPKRIKKGILNLPENNGTSIIEKAKMKAK